MSKVTRLRWLSSSSKEGLEAVVNNLGFKVEIKSIEKDGSSWVMWFVLPDHIDQKSFSQALTKKAELNSMGVDL